MNNNPLVSILVPVYNVEKYIERCARSVFEQTYENLEYIFVDDCTPDNSVAILQKVMEDYPDRKKQTKIIHHDRNRGIAATRNTAVENCSGDFLTHVDSDDWIELNAVEIFVKKQQENDADIVSSNTFSHFSDGSFKIGDTCSSLQGDPFLKIISAKAAHHLWGRLIRVDLYRKNGILCKEGVNQGEDLQTFPQLAYYCHFHDCVNIPLYHYNAFNINSYSYKEHYSLSDIVQIHESFNIFYSFLIPKESEKYGKVLAKRKMDYLFFLMKLCVRIGAKDSFNQFKIELTDLEDQNKDIKYRDIVHWLRRSYYLTRPVLFICR